MEPQQPLYGLYREPPPPPARPPTSVLSAYGFAFKTLRDHPWVILPIAVLHVVPILGPLVMAGLTAFLFQRLVRRDATPLPPFRLDDIGALCRRGLPVLLAQLAFSFVMMFVCIIPMFLLPFVTLTHDQGAIVTGIGFWILWTFCLNVLTYVLLSASLTRAEATEDIGATFSAAAVWDYGRRMGAPLAWGSFMAILLAIPLFMVGLLCFFFGIYLAIAMYGLAMMHYRWQVYERYLWMGGDPLPLAGGQ